ncbi:MAG: DUF2141 domain-containing protein [Flavobacteriaceae bacterium]|nr:DUF2141 domain-containing protein [Flavobacteriaceae bacterium]
MATFVIYLSLFLSCLLMHAQNSIEVTVEGFSNDQGMAVIGLYDTKTDFMEKEFRITTQPIRNQSASYLFKNVPDGTYAIAVFHDEDEDGEFDILFGLFAIEDYGVSNNTPPRFKPPQWEDARFKVLKGTEITQQIRLF